MNSFEILGTICKDMDEWPQSWAGDDDDIIVGAKLLEEFQSYLSSLVEKGRAKATIKKHATYIWTLGGEILRDTNTHGVDPNLPGKQLLLKYINSDGGPFWRDANNEEDFQQYDSVCRRLYKFLTKMS